MNLRSITLPQALILIACVAGTVCAYKFLGENAGHATAIVSMILNFMVGRSDGGGGGGSSTGTPDLKIIAGGAAGAASALLVIVGVAMTAAACGSVLPQIDDPELQSVSAKLAKCRADARAYAQVQPNPQSKDTAEAAYAVYERCKIESGISGAK